MEKKAIPLALSMRLPNTPGLSRIPSLHSHSNIVQIPTTAYTQQNRAIHRSGEEKGNITATKNGDTQLRLRKEIPELFLALMWPKKLRNNPKSWGKQ